MGGAGVGRLLGLRGGWGGWDFLEALALGLEMDGEDGGDFGVGEGAVGEGCGDEIVEGRL